MYACSLSTFLITNAVFSFSFILANCHSLTHCLQLSNFIMRTPLIYLALIAAAIQAQSLNTRIEASTPQEQEKKNSVFWREQIDHNGKPAYMSSDDADLYAVWRDVRNSTFGGGVVGDGVTDDSVAIQAAINCL